MWSEEAAKNMCTVWRQKIKEYDPLKKRVAVENRNFGGTRARYFIENTPYLLDTTSEFYYDNTIRRMFIRLDKVKILRNRVYDNGGRQLSRWSSPVPAISGYLIDAEIAGNIVNIHREIAISCYFT